MQGWTLVLFAMAAGFTVSSIAANVYRLVAPAPIQNKGWLWRTAVMIFAGPNLCFDAAMKRRAAKTWSPPLFWCALAGVAYWSMALGLLVIDVAVNF